MRGYDEDSPFHYHMRTRQSCNIVYLDDDFRTTKKTEDNKELIEDMKAKAFQKIFDDNSLGVDKDLKNLSPKMFQIMKHVEKFMKDGKPTGKILFYSDFRSDGGSEAFELVLRSNGYQKFDTKDPQKEVKDILLLLDRRTDGISKEYLTMKIIKENIFNLYYLKRRC